MRQKYGWAPGAPFNGDPNEVQAEIEELRGLPGGATAETVYERARSKSSALHPLIFNVKTSEAARRYYLSRAGAVLNAIRIVNTEGEVTHLRANIRVATGSEDSIYVGPDDESARNRRAAFLRGRLLNIRTELKELELYPQVALAIDEALAA